MEWLFKGSVALCSTFTPLPDITASEVAVILQKAQGHVQVCYRDCEEYLSIPENIRRHLPLTKGKCP